MKKNKAKPKSYTDRCLNNVKKHLLLDHKVADPTGRFEVRGEKRKLNHITNYLDLDTKNAADVTFANKLIKNFSRSHFQRLIVNWIVEANLPFSTAEHPALREVFDYLNNAVGITNANMTGPTVAKRIVEEYNRHKDTVIEKLKSSRGQIHIAFDGARTRNRKALQGVVAFFRDENDQPQKVVLGLPELEGRHTGVNIAEQVNAILESFQIQDRVGYFILDNASNNDTAMEQLGDDLELDGIGRRVRCFGHIINLAAKALLFGKDANAFEEQLSNGSVATQEEHDVWMEKGPVGKVHAWAVATHGSDILTNSLLELQRKAFAASDDPKEREQTPVTLIIDVLTRWLSTYYMIKRALKLQRFYEHHRLEALQRWKDEYLTARGVPRRGAKRPAWLEEDARITDEDWAVLQHFHDVLHPFHVALMELEGDGKLRDRQDGVSRRFGLMPDLLLAFEYLLSELEAAKSTADRYPDGHFFAANVNLGWEKLNEYYSRLSESPAYYAALALHPAHRFATFEQCWSDTHPEWVDNARETVRKLWDEEYSQLPLDEGTTEVPQTAPRETLSAFSKFRVSKRIALSSLYGHADPIDEYDRWFRDVDPTDEQVEDPLEYWHHQRHRYPRLSRMALDVMTIPTMSAEVERLFSSIGNMVADQRHRLDAMIISIAQVLRSWIRAGIIKQLDDKLALPVAYNQEPLIEVDQS